jgi:hypothetical protein
MTITDRDIREQVGAAISASGQELAEGIDVDGIVSEIIATYGLVGIDDIEGGKFWAMVERHDSTQHCRPGGYDDEAQRQTPCSDVDNGGECVHCGCCCECLGCEYGPRNGMGMTEEQRAGAAAIAESTGGN